MPPSPRSWAAGPRRPSRCVERAAGGPHADAVHAVVPIAALTPPRTSQPRCSPPSRATGEAPLSKKCPILGDSRVSQPTIKPVGVSNEQMVRQLDEIFSSPRAVDPFSRVHVCEPVRCPPRFIPVQVASICAISWIFGGSARSRKRRFGVMIISSHASTGGTLSAPRVQI